MPPTGGDAPPPPDGLLGPHGPSASRSSKRLQGQRRPLSTVATVHCGPKPAWHLGQPQACAVRRLLSAPPPRWGPRRLSPGTSCAREPRGSALRGPGSSLARAASTASRRAPAHAPEPSPGATRLLCGRPRRSDRSQPPPWVTPALEDAPAAAVTATRPGSGCRWAQVRLGGLPAALPVSPRSPPATHLEGVPRHVELRGDEGALGVIWGQGGESSGQGPWGPARGGHSRPCTPRGGPPARLSTQRAILGLGGAMVRRGASATAAV